MFEQGFLLMTLSNFSVDFLRFRLVSDFAVTSDLKGHTKSELIGAYWCLQEGKQAPDWVTVNPEIAMPFGNTPTAVYRYSSRYNLNRPAVLVWKPEKVKVIPVHQGMVWKAENGIVEPGMMNSVVMNHLLQRPKMLLDSWRRQFLYFFGTVYFGKGGIDCDHHLIGYIRHDGSARSDWRSDHHRTEEILRMLQNGQGDRMRAIIME